MNGRNCGKPLTINSSICPVCGIDNDSMQEETLFVELDGEDEEPKITENMVNSLLSHKTTHKETVFRWLDSMSAGIKGVRFSKMCHVLLKCHFCL